MTTSLLLDQLAWDLVVDIDGNLAVCDEPYSSAQDAMCAIRLFQGELWFDTSQGVPYFNRILGQLPPVSFIKGQIAAACLSVPTVASAVVFLGSFVNRQLVGQVNLTLNSGDAAVVNVGSPGISVG